MYALVKPHFSQFGETGICPGWGAIPRPRPRRPVSRASPSAKFFRPPSEKKKNLIHIKSWGRGGTGEAGGMGRRGWEGYWGVEKLKGGGEGRGEAISYTVCMGHTSPLTIWPPHPDIPPKFQIEKNQSKSAQPSVITSAGILGVRGGGRRVAHSFRFEVVMAPAITVRVCPAPAGQRKRGPKPPSIVTASRLEPSRPRAPWPARPSVPAGLWLRSDRTHAALPAACPMRR